MSGPLACAVATHDGDLLTLLDDRLWALLMHHSGQVLTRDQIFQLVWGRKLDTSSKSVDIAMLRLRRKIEYLPAAPRLIVTVRGVGYCYHSPVRLLP